MPVAAAAAAGTMADQFARQGYVTLRGVLSPDEVRHFVDELARELAAVRLSFHRL